MITYAIVCILNNEKVQAVKTLLLSVKLIFNEKIQLSHKGVKQLLFILKEKYISMYAFVELAYRTQMDARFFSKVSLYEIDLGRLPWERMLNEIDELCRIVYGNNKKIYDVDIEDVKIYF